MTLTNETSIAQAFPPAVLGRGYSDAELNLIKAIWADTKQVAQQKMQLCIHLYELKQEMDANDPNVTNGGGGKGQTRFWSEFEKKRQGNESSCLPEYVTDSKPRACEWLQAAQFAMSGQLSGASDSSLLSLTPSTVCNLARISNPKAIKIAKQHLQAHEFIGHDAASYLAKNNLDGDVLDKLQTWIEANEKKALVPSVIREVEAKVRESQQPASTRTIDAEQIREQQAEFKRISDDLTARAPEIAARNTATAVKEELNRPAKEHQEKLEGEVRKYNSKLNAAAEAVQDLLTCLIAIDRVHGTQYLDEMRGADLMGLVSVQDDLRRLLAMGQELMKVVELAKSSNPPSGIDMTTLEVEQL
jgi:hypothetical protein